MINTIFGVVSGLVLAGTSRAIMASTSLEWWQVLLIGLIPPVLGFISDVVKNLLISKGFISKEEGDKMVDEFKDKLEELTDKDKKDDKDKDNGDNENKDEGNNAEGK